VVVLLLDGVLVEQFAGLQIPDADLADGRGAGCEVSGVVGDRDGSDTIGMLGLVLQQFGSGGGVEAVDEAVRTHQEDLFCVGGKRGSEGVNPVIGDLADLFGGGEF